MATISWILNGKWVEWYIIWKDTKFSVWWYLLYSLHFTWTLRKLYGINDTFKDILVIRSQNNFNYFILIITCELNANKIIFRAKWLFHRLYFCVKIKQRNTKRKEDQLKLFIYTLFLKIIPWLTAHKYLICCQITQKIYRLWSLCNVKW